MSGEIETLEVTEKADYTKAEQQHYRAIVEAERNLHIASNALARTRDDYKAAKADYDAEVTALRDLIRRGPNPQLNLPGMDGSEDAWRTVPLEEVGLKPGQVKAFAENDPPLKTLGEFSDWQQETGLSMTAIKGIGEAAAERIETVLEQFWRDHPEYTPSEPEEEDDDEEEDDK